MRDISARSVRGGSCPEELVLDSWLEDASPYLQLRLAPQARGRRTDVVTASPLSAGRLPGSHAAPRPADS